jgi:hypothetical protein
MIMVSAFLCSEGLGSAFWVFGSGLYFFCFCNKGFNFLVTKEFYLTKFQSPPKWILFPVLGTTFATVAKTVASAVANFLKYVVCDSYFKMVAIEVSQNDYFLVVKLLYILSYQ